MTSRRSTMSRLCSKQTCLHYQASSISLERPCDGDWGIGMNFLEQRRSAALHHDKDLAKKVASALL